jgi:hypothetical protein
MVRAENESLKRENEVLRDANGVLMVAAAYYEKWSEEIKRQMEKIGR